MVTNFRYHHPRPFIRCGFHGVTEVGIRANGYSGLKGWIITSKVFLNKKKTFFLSK
jgi:hypothetical protein